MFKGKPLPLNEQLGETMYRAWAECCVEHANTMGLNYGKWSDGLGGLAHTYRKSNGGSSGSQIRWSYWNWQSSTSSTS
jgi:hypothetical protein